jgi:hypothetical protein
VKVCSAGLAQARTELAAKAARNVDAILPAEKRL